MQFCQKLFVSMVIYDVKRGFVLAILPRSDKLTNYLLWSEKLRM